MSGRVLTFVLLAVACSDATGPVTLDPPALTLTIGNHRQLTVLYGGKLLPPDPGIPFVWTTSDTAVARVSATGDVLALRGGTAHVSVEVGGGTGATDVLVIPSAAGVWLASTADSFYTFTLNEVIPGGSTTGTVSGSLTVRDPNDVPTTFTVDGTHSHPHVTLRWTRSGQQDGTFSGSFPNDTSIAGVVDSMGPSAYSLTLTRPTCYCPWLVPAPAGVGQSAPTGDCGAVVLCAPPATGWVVAPNDRTWLH